VLLHRQDNVYGVGQINLYALELLDIFLDTRAAKPSACRIDQVPAF